MIHITTHDATGRIRQAMTLRPDEVAMNTPEGGGWVEGHHDGAVSYVAGGVITPRPDTGLPESHTLSTDTDWTLPDVPEGTDIVIDGEVHAVSDGSDLEMSFPEPGEYMIKLRPPFPWIGAECVLEVTDAN